MVGTYHNLRAGLVVIGASLPLLLWLGGVLVDREPLRCSMSAYYHSENLRNVFVAALVVVGALLYLYKGFSTWENLALNVAGLCAAVILSFAVQARESAIFIVEAFAVWAFSLYWFFKSREMKESQAEREAMEGTLQARSTPELPLAGPGKIIQIAELVPARGPEDLRG